MDRSTDRSGPCPVVFLHAFPLHGGMWDEVRRALSLRPSQAPDFPGFGALEAGPRSLEVFARSGLDALTRAGIERAVFVGLSMGGYVALRIHALAPGRVAALVLANTRAGADSEEGRTRRDEQAARARSEGVGWLPEALLPALLGETTRRERPEVVDRVRARLLAADPEGVARALEAMRDRPDSTRDLAAIRVPVLAIAGEEDTLTPPEELRRIVEGVPDGTLVTLPRAGHLSAIETPEPFAQALEAFLKRLDDGQG